jgi:hypothetical protein
VTAAVAGAVLIALPAATRIPIMSRVLAAPDTVARLVVPQTFRILGALFLVVAVLTPLPLLLAVPAGLGDTATGVAAPFVARRLARGTIAERRFALVPTYAVPLAMTMHVVSLGRLLPRRARARQAALQQA